MEEFKIIYLLISLFVPFLKNELIYFIINLKSMLESEKVKKEDFMKEYKL